MQLRYKFELRCQLDRLRHSLDSAKTLFRLGVGWEDHSKNKTNLSQIFSWSWGWAWQKSSGSFDVPEGSNEGISLYLDFEILVLNKFKIFIFEVWPVKNFFIYFNLFMVQWTICLRTKNCILCECARQSQRSFWLSFY